MMSARAERSQIDRQFWTRGLLRALAQAWVALFLVLAMLGMIAGGVSVDILVGAAMIAIGILLIGSPLVLLILLAAPQRERAYLSQATPDPTLCQTCGYSIVGLDGIGVCPECGEAIALEGASGQEG